MRHREAVGTRASMAVQVTEDMAARFDDEHVHPVYGTAALVRHAEQVSRRLLVPHLEPGEEGVGARIEVDQLAPVPLGRRVELTATVVHATPRRLVTEVEARHGDRLVARATFVQAIVRLQEWRHRVGS